MKVFDDFKTSQKCMEQFFLIWNAYMFWKFIQYTIHWDKTQMLKKFLSDKISGVKNAHLFLSRAPTHHSFTFNLWFLYDLKHKVCLSLTVCGIFHFRFRYFQYSYTLPKEDPKNIWNTWHNPWVLLISAFLPQKSVNFAISRNRDIDSILVHDF